ncbi:hypothetical protein [Butyrivibrio sp. YAB3001]|uniref:hypothetical protein n=1 Tax=Butyrivibrio sp. YAB3001 TaxID=1520812 RepID=UPI0008F63AD4|nr:hypothetical protein [Butyrivibrio sp. YAB3001]SFC94654.1 hypothetical protein SAMN02910398_03591 [Butyrivibrio sp. YAB3001]
MTSEEKIDFLIETMGRFGKKLDSFDEKFDKIDEKFDKIDEKFDKIDEKFDKIDEKFDKIDEKFARIDERFDSVENRLTNLENDVSGIKLQIENEIIPNIQRVAEGHLDLDRKLREVIKTNADYEVLTLRVNSLEAKVARIEQKIT